jgi:hypothetical protein
MCRQPEYLIMGDGEFFIETFAVVMQTVKNSILVSAAHFLASPSFGLTWYRRACAAREFSQNSQRNM